MLTIAIVAGVVGYLLIGAGLAWGLASSFDFPGPKWLVMPAVALFWPVAIFLPLVAIWSWIKNGSH